MSAERAPATQEQLVEELRRVKEQYELERRRSEGLALELRQAKEHNVAMQKQVEQEEEYITNKLMKRLEELKRDKAKLATEVEREEEFLTNTLQKKLEKLTREKIDLENKLEAEQEYIVNKLRKQLEQLTVERSKLHREKIDLENQLEAEQEYIMNKLQKQVEKLASEKRSLQKEKTDLQRQVSDLGASVDKLNKDKVNLENQMEMEEENIVNRLQRQLDTILAQIRVWEQKLEARGLSLRELGMGSIDVSNETWIYGRSPSKPGGLGRESNSGNFMNKSASGTRRERTISTTGSGSFHSDVCSPTHTPEVCAK